MERSTELKNLTLSFYEAVSKGDVSHLERLFSRRGETLLIGTDPAEWWTNRATIIQTLKTQIEEMGGATMLAGDPQAYSEGTIGWVADRARVKLANGTEVPFRLTAVFRKEEDGWRIVQEHVSVGVRNQEVVGKELTT